MSWLAFWLFVLMGIVSLVVGAAKENAKPTCHMCGAKCSGDHQLSFTDNNKSIPTITVAICRPCWYNPETLSGAISDISKGN